MKACTLRCHLGSRNRIMAVGNRSIHKEGGTPKAREDQREGTLRISWLFSRLGSLIHSRLQMEKKKYELVRNMQARVRGSLNVWATCIFIGGAAEGT
jgi:hypothetical protein